MISVERDLVVGTSADATWNFVKDMGNWASQMPGYLSHEVISEDDSAWTVQVNVGPFTRPFTMDVHVTKWTAPSEVTFEVKGRHEPFRGSGAFRAFPRDDHTEVQLRFEAEGTGSMAKVVSAMAAPVLKFVADEFSTNLAAALNGAAQASAPAAAPMPASVWSRLWQRIRAVISRLPARKRSDGAK